MCFGARLFRVGVNAAMRSAITCSDFGALKCRRILNSPVRFNPQGPQNRGSLRALIEAHEFVAHGPWTKLAVYPLNPKPYTLNPKP